MADLWPVAGAKFYIGGSINLDKDDLIASDFTSQSWVEIDGWETMGAVGDTSEVITTQLINRGRDIKQKGTRNAGSMENNFAIIRDDLGQLAVRAAEKTRNNYAFRIVFEDETELMFAGLVMSAQEQGGGANTVQMLAVNIETNSNILEA